MFKREFNKYYTLLTLYLAQSIPMSFFATVIPVIMRMENYSLESIGYIQLIKLPWIIKFLWAPLIDRKSTDSKKYRLWIISSEVFYAVIIISIGFFNLQTSFTTIIVLMIIAFIASATQDIATDAFAILILKDKERSLGNSMQSAGSFLGTMVGSGIMLIIYHYWGWKYLLISLGIFVLIALIPVSFYKKTHERRLQKNIKSVSSLEFIYFFKQRHIGGHIVLLLLFYSGIIGILTMIKPYLVDLGYDLKQIGFISGIYGTACGAIMTVPAGLLIRKKGLKRSVWVFPVISLITAIYFVALTFTSHPDYLIYIGIALLWSAYAISTVFIFTLGMKIVRTGREGTDFTIQIVLTHLSSMIIAVLSGKVADILTYRGLFLIETGLGVVLLITLPLIFTKSFNENYENT